MSSEAKENQICGNGMDLISLKYKRQSSQIDLALNSRGEDLRNMQGREIL